ncbi:MAG: hypothetical protein C0507_02055 [Cyanobacteria bacterium PR.3.49]|jgi:hypothetical protein|nr:hypothetical protein [Cyanobacteria bacterium PR.3.49]
MVRGFKQRYLSVILLGIFIFSATAPKPAYSERPRPQSEIPVEKQRLLPATKKVEMTGEVVDAWCFASQVMGPGRGEKHKACALACIHGGVSAGILDEKTGELFIAAKHKGYTGCKDLLLPFVAKRVTVKGWIARKGGCNLIKIQEVKLAKPGEKTTK